jgi:AbrB family looped-hinge helix DNA binding protein
VGQCKRSNPFRGYVKVSDKGQIVIPADLLRELNIKKGDQLFIAKRDDDVGFIALKSDAFANMMSKILASNPF